MTRLDEVMGWVAERLPALTEQYDVPGAAVGVLADGEVADQAAGLLSLSTKVEATVDSVFQVGSITKLWTSTLVMQLVDEGTVDLDAPIRTYLPELRIGDEGALEQITVRRLLTHTAGFEGDLFTDTGLDDDSVAKFVDTLHDVAQLFAPGEMWSYNNAGFVVLGRLVEVLRGQSYDACLRERLVLPLGLTHVASSPYEAIMFRAAVGHIETEPGAGYHPAPVWALPRSNAPAGAMLAMRPRDLLAFARMHLDDGRASDGTQILAPGTAGLMHEHQVAVPDLGGLGNSWGLGFERFDTPDGVFFGHDGNTVGQSAFLRIVSEAGVAVTLLTNGGDAMSLYRDVVGHVVDELTDVRLPALPVPSDDPPRIDASRYVGTYSCDIVDVEVSQEDDGGIWLATTPKGVAVEFGDQPQREEFVHHQGDTLIQLKPERGLHPMIAFLDDDGSGHSLYAHAGRAIRRAGA